MPPWPGRIEPESLTPVDRLNSDSTRSPICPSIAPGTAISTRSTHGSASWKRVSFITIAASSEPAMPPNAPSHVFFGDTASYSLCLPRKRPAKYAPVSPSHITTSTNSTQSPPWLPPPSRLSAAAQVKSTPA